MTVAAQNYFYAGTNAIEFVFSKLENLMTKFKETINEIKKRYKDNKIVLKIVLYGSVARGDYSERHSDLDLFVVVNSKKVNKKVVEKIKHVLEKIGIKQGVKVHPEFQGKETTIEDHTLLQKLLIEGKIIVDNYPKLLYDIDAFGLKPYHIYEYNAFKSKKRTSFSKLLHGKKVKYKSKGGLKKSIYKGIADKKNIILLGRNVIMVKTNVDKEVKEIFQNFNVEYKFRGLVFK